MLDQLRVAAALAACCFVCPGCRSVMDCGDGCQRGNSLAFSKYDCSCDDACGGAKCGGSTSCGCKGAGDNCGCGGDKSRWRLLDRICGCHGCGEWYWNEWHNDPPMVCEPCDHCGSYIGPGQPGYYRAPYRTADLMTTGKAWAPQALEVAESDVETDAEVVTEPVP